MSKFSSKSRQLSFAFEAKPTTEVRMGGATFEVRDKVQNLLVEQFDGRVNQGGYIEFPLEKMEEVRQAIEKIIPSNHVVEKGFGNSKILFVQEKEEERCDDMVNPGYDHWRRR